MLNFLIFVIAPFFCHIGNTPHPLPHSWPVWDQIFNIYNTAIATLQGFVTICLWFASGVYYAGLTMLPSANQKPNCIYYLKNYWRSKQQPLNHHEKLFSSLNTTILAQNHSKKFGLGIYTIQIAWMLFWPNCSYAIVCMFTLCMQLPATGYFKFYTNKTTL